MANDTLISIIGFYRLAVLQQVGCVTKGKENNKGKRHIGLETWLNMKVLGLSLQNIKTFLF
jgi:hypothetical protein